MVQDFDTNAISSMKAQVSQGGRIPHILEFGSIWRQRARSNTRFFLFPWKWHRTSLWIKGCTDSKKSCCI